MTRNSVALFRWDDLPLEPVTPTLDRKIVTGERVMLGHVWLKNGCVVPLHSHEAEQHTYVFSGALEFSIEGKTYTVRAGEVLCIPSWVKHQAVALGDVHEMDVFGPIRYDWLDKTDAYFNSAPVAPAAIEAGGSTIRLYRWDDMPGEPMTEQVVRRFLGGDQVTLARIHLAAGAVVPTHQHESEQLTWVQSGHLRLQVGNETFDVKAGNVLRIPSFLPHRADAVVDTIAVDAFSPIRQDWLSGNDQYMRNASAAGK